MVPIGQDALFSADGRSGQLAVLISERETGALIENGRTGALDLGDRCRARKL
jgi:hypothetical protein